MAKFEFGNKAAVGNSGGLEKIHTPEFIENEAKELEKWIAKEKNIWVNKFATERGYSRQRFSEWEKTHPVFADSYKKAKEIQEHKLVEGGLYNKTNSGFTKFILVNAHKYRDKNEDEANESRMPPLIKMADDAEARRQAIQSTTGGGSEASPSSDVK